MLSLTTVDRATATAVMTAKRIMAPVAAMRAEMTRALAPTQAGADGRARRGRGRRRPRCSPGRSTSATSASTSATRPMRSSSRPPRSGCQEVDAAASSTMPPRRSATTTGSVGSSTISEPLRSAAAARAAKPTRGAGAGQRPHHEQVGAQEREPHAGERHEEQRELRREPHLYVGGRHGPGCYLSLRVVGRVRLMEPGGARRLERDPVTPERRQRVQRLLERIDCDHLEIVSDGRPGPRRTRRTARETPHIRHFGQRPPSARRRRPARRCRRSRSCP